MERLSPAVRHKVLNENIDTSNFRGSGKGGRVLMEDLNVSDKKHLCQ